MEEITVYIEKGMPDGHKIVFMMLQCKYLYRLLPKCQMNIQIILLEI